MNIFVSICRSLHLLLFMNKTQSVIENDETTTVKLTEAKVFQMLSKHCEKKGNLCSVSTFVMASM